MSFKIHLERNFRSNFWAKQVNFLRRGLWGHLIASVMIVLAYFIKSNSSELALTIFISIILLWLSLILLSQILIVLSSIFQSTNKGVDIEFSESYITIINLKKKTKKEYNWSQVENVVFLKKTVVFRLHKRGPYWISIQKTLLDKEQLTFIMHQIYS